MFLILAVVLVLLWIGGFFIFHVSSFLIHLLLLFALISMIMNFVRRPPLRVVTAVEQQKGRPLGVRPFAFINIPLLVSQRLRPGTQNGRNDIPPEPPASPLPVASASLPVQSAALRPSPPQSAASSSSSANPATPPDPCDCRSAGSPRIHPARCAASSFSFKPPIGSTFPRSVISPVIAISRRTLILVSALASAGRNRDARLKARPSASRLPAHARGCRRCDRNPSAVQGAPIATECRSAQPPPTPSSHRPSCPVADILPLPSSTCTSVCRITPPNRRPTPNPVTRPIFALHMHFGILELRHTQQTFQAYRPSPSPWEPPRLPACAALLFAQLCG